MSNQTKEFVAEEKRSAAKNINWGNIGILFSTLAVIISISAFGYGYFQLSQVTITVARTVAGLQAQTTNSQSNLSTLQQAVNELRQAAEKAQKAQEPDVQQEQMINELYSRLTVIDNQLDQLPLLVTQQSTKDNLQQEVPAVAETPGLSWWQMGVQRSWQALRKIVIVRYIGTNSVPLVVPEEKGFLYQNLHAQINAAMWGTLHHNNMVYQTSLSRAAAWIQKYFIQDASETKNVLQELLELQKMNIAAKAQ